MTDDTLTSVDTITIAALLSALQVVIEAYRTERPQAEALDALEAEAVSRIKALDTGDFTYEEQAEGLAEGMMLARSMFRYVRADGGPAQNTVASAPESEMPAPETSVEMSLLQRH